MERNSRKQWEKDGKHVKLTKKKMIRENLRKKRDSELKEYFKREGGKGTKNKESRKGCRTVKSEGCRET